MKCFSGSENWTQEWQDEMNEMEQQVAWFSNPANDNWSTYNFFEATGGKATIEMGQLDKSLKTAPD